MSINDNDNKIYGPNNYIILKGTINNIEKTI